MIDISVLGINWKQKSFTQSQVIHVMQNNKFMSEILARLIVLRMIEVESVDNFINPKIKNLIPDPMHLIDMEVAINRIIRAIINKESICVLGDYDVDGATSSAILKKFFKSTGLDVKVYIPDRIKDGYGPSVKLVNKIKLESIDLLITVDCGASAHEAVEVANSINLDVIVIDHHIMTDQPPNTIATINPNRLDEKTQYKYLAAVGVTFLFLVGLSRKLREMNFWSNTLVEPNLIEYLDLVALGTVCDVMPLVGLNRAFVASGLKILSQRKNTGLRILLDMLKINTKPTAYHLGFIIGPRINAGGRVGKSYFGAELLSSDIEERCYDVAIKLELYNSERKEIEQAVLLEADIIAANLPRGSNVIFVYSEEWHVGVIGIVASRLKDKYNKPTVVISVDKESGVCKASCRSIKGIDIGNKIINAKLFGLIDEGGGHAMAAGFSTNKSLLDRLYIFLNDTIGAECHDNLSNNILEYDISVSFNGLNAELLNEISVLEPFGAGNPEPLIRMENIKIISTKIVGEKHLLCFFTNAYNQEVKSTKVIKGIAFDAISSGIEKALCDNVKIISLIGYIQKDTYDAKNESIQFIIKDCIVTT